MSGGEAAASSRSPLEKPLADLTEEDIAQVTREDCRRFLKERGMRRPSWNKSQAIQQVISLNALLEGRPGAGDPPVTCFLTHSKSPSRILPTPSREHVPASAPYSEKKEISGVGSPPSQPEPSPYRRRDPLPPPPQQIFSGGNPSPPYRANDTTPPENNNRLSSNNSSLPTRGKKVNSPDSLLGVRTEDAREESETWRSHSRRMDVLT